jgi:hypothetical protein
LEARPAGVRSADELFTRHHEDETDFAEAKGEESVKLVSVLGRLGDARAGVPLNVEFLKHRIHGKTLVSRNFAEDRAKRARLERGHAREWSDDAHHRSVW